MVPKPVSSTPKRAVRLITLSVLWVLVCIVLVAPVAGVIQLLAAAMHRPALADSLGLQVAVEALLYLAAAFVVFRVARRPGLSPHIWLLAPVGYLVSFGVYVLLMRLVASWDAAPHGSGWAIVVADVLGTALGGWAGMALGAARRGRVAEVLEPPSEEAAL